MTKAKMRTPYATYSFSRKSGPIGEMRVHLPVSAGEGMKKTLCGLKTKGMWSIWGSVLKDECCQRCWKLAGYP